MRLRFSLRTLLLLITASSVWLGWHIHATRRQEHAVKAILAYGGWVRYDFQFSTKGYAPQNFDPKAESNVPRWLVEQLGVDFFHSVVQVNLNYSDDSGTRKENSNTSDEALQYLPAMPDIRVLLLQNTQARDSSLKHVSNLRKLEHLYMWDVSLVSDAGVEHLEGLHNLKSVHINDSRISDGALRVFGRLENLEELSLQGNHFSDDGLANLVDLQRLRSLWANQGTTRISDRGLEHLVQLSQLETLAIQGDSITDDGLQTLARLKGLKWLMVSSNTVTEEGAERLRAKLGNAKIELYHLIPTKAGETMWGLVR